MNALILHDCFYSYPLVKDAEYYGRLSQIKTNEIHFEQPSSIVTIRLAINIRHSIKITIRLIPN